MMKKMSHTGTGVVVLVLLFTIVIAINYRDEGRAASHDGLVTADDNIATRELDHSFDNSGGPGVPKERVSGILTAFPTDEPLPCPKALGEEACNRVLTQINTVDLTEAGDTGTNFPTVLSIESQCEILINAWDLHKPLDSRAPSEKFGESSPGWTQRMPNGRIYSLRPLKDGVEQTFEQYNYCKELLAWRKRWKPTSFPEANDEEDLRNVDRLRDLRFQSYQAKQQGDGHFEHEFPLTAMEFTQDGLPIYPFTYSPRRGFFSTVEFDENGEPRKYDIIHNLFIIPSKLARNLTCYGSGGLAPLCIYEDGRVAGRAAGNYWNWAEHNCVTEYRDTHNVGLGLVICDGTEPSRHESKPLSSYWRS